MSAFIAKYWIEFLFGVIAAGATALAKRFYTLYKKEQKFQKENEQEELKDSINKELIDIIDKDREESRQGDELIQKQINNISNEIAVLKAGILGIQGKAFKEDCHRLLDPNHVITQEEWDELSLEHDVYNQLGGNHDGDRLYGDVQAKYHNSLK